MVSSDSQGGNYPFDAVSSKALLRFSTADKMDIPAVTLATILVEAARSRQLAKKSWQIRKHHWNGCFIFWNGFLKVFLNSRFAEDSCEVKNVNSKTKGAFILGLVFVAVVASTFVLSASAANQTRDRTQDQVRDCDCTNDCTCDGTQTQTRDQTQTQSQDCTCPNDCACDGTPNQVGGGSQNRAQNRGCAVDLVKDQIQLRTQLQIRDC